MYQTKARSRPVLSAMSTSSTIGCREALFNFLVALKDIDDGREIDQSERSLRQIR
jgi:hypothetical protein